MGEKYHPKLKTFYSTFCYRGQKLGKEKIELMIPPILSNNTTVIKADVDQFRLILCEEPNEYDNGYWQPIEYITQDKRSPFLRIPNCYILGKKTVWLENFEGLTNYNKEKGILVVMCPYSTVKFHYNSNGSIFRSKFLSLTESFGGETYAVMVMKLNYPIEYCIESNLREQSVSFESRKEFFKAHLTIDSVIRYGSNSNNSFQFIQHFIQRIDCFGKFIIFLIKLNIALTFDCSQL